LLLHSDMTWSYGSGASGMQAVGKAVLLQTHTG